MKETKSFFFIICCLFAAFQLINVIGNVRYGTFEGAFVAFVLMLVWAGVAAWQYRKIKKESKKPIIVTTKTRKQNRNKK